METTDLVEQKPLTIFSTITVVACTLNTTSSKNTLILLVLLWSPCHQKNQTKQTWPSVVLWAGILPSSRKSLPLTCGGSDVMLLTWHSRLPALVNRFSPIHLEAPLSPVGETSGWSWCCGRWSIFGPSGFGPQTIRQGEARSPRQHRHQLRRDTPSCLKWKTHINSPAFYWCREIDLSGVPRVEEKKKFQKEFEVKISVKSSKPKPVEML